jgi:hypothetical protein
MQGSLLRFYVHEGDRHDGHVSVAIAATQVESAMMQR